MLFNSIVYGPIHSRRLGMSLGINLLPVQDKICTFNCIYCECGWNTSGKHGEFPTREQVYVALKTQLERLTDQLDTITFSGNGEPTLHPQFADIIHDTCELRDIYCPTAKVSVLTNSTQVALPTIQQALMKADNRILKLDSAITSTMRLINQPMNPQLKVSQIVNWLKPMRHRFILQTCFLRGKYNEHIVDNTTQRELHAWYRIVEFLQPQSVMIYVIDRITPCATLEKLSRMEMERIAAPVRAMGIEISISA